MLLLYTCCVFLVGLAVVSPAGALKPNPAKCMRQINECQCEMEGGKMLDLRPFDSNNTVKPAFGGHDPGSNCSYLYSPCTPFTNNGTYGCQTAAVCQTGPSIGSFNAGYHHTAEFITAWKYGLAVRYHTLTSGAVLTSTVYLSCSDSDMPEYKVMGELPQFGSGTIVRIEECLQLNILNNNNFE